MSIKVSYEGEMRRFGASTYEDLQKQVATLFDLDAFLLKYQDEEGDLVTVSSEWELDEALRCQGPVLRLNVEVTDEQSGDFILVQRDCVVHVDQTVEDKPSDALPSPLTTELLTTSQASESVPMALTPLPQITQTMPQSPPGQEAASPVRQSASTQNGSKRSYAEACESKSPYSQATRRGATYIVSVSNARAHPRSGVKSHAVSSAAATPYVQSSNVQKPYAQGKDRSEFVKPKVAAPYAQGKSSPAYARGVEDSHYVSNLMLQHLSRR
jgi:hypothetical protein